VAKKADRRSTRTTWRQVFLDNLAEGATIRMAAQRAGVARSTAYAHRDADADFAEGWDDAYEAGTDRLEDAMRGGTRAHVRKPKVGSTGPMEWPRPKNAAPTLEQHELFLAELRSGATVTEACQAAGFGRTYAYRRRRTDDAFARAWLDVIEEGTETLERECQRRAMEGSDLLMIFLLKSRRPEVYRDRYEIQQTAGAPLTAGDLEAIRGAGARPELAEHLDALADALAEQHRGRVDAAQLPVVTIEPEEAR